MSKPKNISVRVGTPEGKPRQVRLRVETLEAKPRQVWLRVYPAGGEAEARTQTFKMLRLDYLPGGVAHRAQAGKVLVHNFVPDRERQKVETRGFQVWQVPKSAAANEYALCKCGWRPDLGRHYTLGLTERKTRKR